GSIDQQIHHSIPIYQIVENKLGQLPPQPLSFYYLTKIRETVYIIYKQ
ncbi:9099_t:CDS:1, partial [Gigaspora margarita]